jgi:hypothetical protein
VLRDNPVEIFWRTFSIPDTVRINYGDWTIVANPQAIRLAALDAAMLTEPQLQQSLFEMLPTRCGLFRRAASLFIGSGAEKNMSPGSSKAKFFDSTDSFVANCFVVHAVTPARLSDSSPIMVWINFYA